jgi:hypothetical protein
MRGYAELAAPGVAVAVAVNDHVAVNVNAPTVDADP